MKTNRSIDRRWKKFQLIACYINAMSSGTLYLNIATFMPLFIKEKFGHNELTEELSLTERPIHMISAFEVSLIIVAFELAFILAPCFTVPMLTKFGRRNCILIGLAFDAVCSVLLALTDFFDVT